MKRHELRWKVRPYVWLLLRRLQQSLEHLGYNINYPPLVLTYLTVESQIFDFSTFRCINKETRLFFGKNRLSGDFVRREFRLPKGTDYSLSEVPHFPGNIYLVWNPVNIELLYARNRKVLWRILFIWSLRPTLLRRWNLFY